MDVAATSFFGTTAVPMAAMAGDAAGALAFRQAVAALASPQPAAAIAMPVLMAAAAMPVPAQTRLPAHPGHAAAAVSEPLVPVTVETASAAVLLPGRAGPIILAEPRAASTLAMPVAPPAAPAPVAPPAAPAVPVPATAATSAVSTDLPPGAAAAAVPSKVAGEASPPGAAVSEPAPRPSKPLPMADAAEATVERGGLLADRSVETVRPVPDRTPRPLVIRRAETARADPQESVLLERLPAPIDASGIQVQLAIIVAATGLPTPPAPAPAPALAPQAAGARRLVVAQSSGPAAPDAVETPAASDPGLPPPIGSAIMLPLAAPPAAGLHSPVVQADRSRPVAERAVTPIRRVADGVPMPAFEASLPAVPAGIADSQLAVAATRSAAASLLAAEPVVMATAAVVVPQAIRASVGQPPAPVASPVAFTMPTAAAAPGADIADTVAPPDLARPGRRQVPSPREALPASASSVPPSAIPVLRVPVAPPAASVAEAPPPDADPARAAIDAPASETAARTAPADFAPVLLPPAPAAPATAPAPAAAPPVVAVPMAYRAATAAHDTGVLVAHRISKGGDELTIRIEPAELGRIDVRMSFDDGGKLRATVGSDNPVVLDLLRRDVAHLVGAMADAGVSSDQRSFRFEPQADSNPGGRASAGSDDRPRDQRPAPDRQPTARARAEDHDSAIFQPIRWAGRLDVTA